MSDDRFALESLLEVSRPGVPHIFSHYLYFPVEKAAAEAAAELRSLGFETEERLSAYGTDWLVLARHKMVPGEQKIVETRRLMTDLACARGGEYDGWEAEVQP